MKNWFDLEPLLDKIETLDKSMLEEFSNIQPPPSQNPAFHHKFDHAIQRVRNRLSEIIAIENSARNPTNKNTSTIHTIGVGITVTVIGAAALWAIAYYFNVHLVPYPSFKRDA